MASSVEQLQKRDEFLLHVPATFLPPLAEEWPEAFFDGNVFKGRYATVTTAAGPLTLLSRSRRLQDPRAQSSRPSSAHQSLAACSTRTTDTPSGRAS